ncbi:hypothetical protein I4I73_13335 [Pseudonocardia sp. KRD-184]|uniref:Uncharacterized protein n=1 Tax=Pseudonocardia oceani TaxID=2792013 RepID=A0ABS6UHH0_9PSEU|nr:hypothetical protein [Pseudonocardia oceani]MBW0089898.1 hypothetical protein [Pseudonocardia oceani]MBW0096971.1 hypothetical protein [Pseudonocardia oceani]MBW0109646.1 hypothetical protein [Pseudonocardia oceani]MBW0122498.1 hypothetical protein [Pseudonocardia oceani]MBW0131682.1 hypothetical protein [Pseudonocardia oceani]
MDVLVALPAGVDPAAEEAWLAVLSLHGDYDDDEWADLCEDEWAALCEGGRRAMGVGRPACGCRPTRARAPVAVRSLRCG